MQTGVDTLIRGTLQLVKYMYQLGGNILDKQVSANSSSIHNRSQVHVCDASGKGSHQLPAMLRELNVRRQEDPLIIKVNNQGSMHLTKNLEYHARTKHIDIQHHFI